MASIPGEARAKLIEAVTQRLDQDGKVRAYDVIRAIRPYFEKWVGIGHQRHIGERKRLNGDNKSLNQLATELGERLVGQAYGDTLKRTWNILSDAAHTPDADNKLLNAENYRTTIEAVFELALQVAGVDEDTRDGELESFQLEHRAFEPNLDCAAQKTSPPRLVAFTRLIARSYGRLPDANHTTLKGELLDTGHEVTIHWEVQGPPAIAISEGMVVGARGIEWRAQGHYNATAHTTLVLAPDLVLAAKELAASRDADQFLAKHLACPSDSINDSMLRGELVHEVVKRCLLANETAEQSETTVKKERAPRFDKVSLHDGGQPRAQNIDGLREKLGPGTFQFEIPYLSPWLGVEGKVDVGTSHQAMRRIELKSGKSRQPRPNQGTSPSDERQVRWYQALQADVEQQAPIDHHVFYAGVSQGAPILATVAYSREQAREVHHSRNRIVSSLLSIREKLTALAPTNQVPFEEVELAFPDDKKALADFQDRWKVVAPETKLLWRWLVAFGIDEQLATAIGLKSNDATPVRSDLWLVDELTKQHGGDATEVARVESVDVARSTIELRFSDCGRDSLRKGDDVLVLDGPREARDCWRGRMLDGTLEVSEPRMMRIRLRRQMEGSFLVRVGEALRVERKVYGLSWSLLATLRHLILQPSDNVKVLTGQSNPGNQTTENAPDEQLLDGLEENQKLAIERAIQAQHGFLVQGPPGSGKTKSVIARLAYHAATTDKRCAILTLTHRAAAEAHRAIAALLEQFGQPAEWVDRVTSTAPRPEAKVIVCTLQRFARLPRGSYGELAIVDEASQVKDGDLVGLLASFKRFVLVGDHRQLPPICVLQADAIPEPPEELRTLGFAKPDRSTFERLWFTPGWETMRIQLTAHFRMHKDIAATIAHAYGDGLTEQVDAQRASAAPGTIAELGRILHLPSEGAPDNKHHHGGEVESAFELCTMLNLEDPKATIGIVSPWRRQVVALRARLSEAHVEVAGVDTVERFQGTECDVIIISMATQKLGHASSPATDGGEAKPNVNIDRKLLVAVSRARKLVILLADDALKKDSGHYATLLDDQATRVCWVAQPGPRVLVRAPE